MKSPLIMTVFLLVAVATPAAAGETVDPDGLISVPLGIRNAGSQPILCQAEIAHWFATDLARVPPGETADLGLHVNTRSGTWATINAAGEALPVERAWCGLEGHTYETRFDLGLGANAPQVQQLACRAEGHALSCH